MVAFAGLYIKACVLSRPLCSGSCLRVQSLGLDLWSMVSVSVMLFARKYVSFPCFLLSSHCYTVFAACKDQSSVASPCQICKLATTAR